MALGTRITEIIADAGISFKEKSRTIYTQCPICNREDKFSVLKDNGACVCYRGSCEFGKRWFTDWIMLTFSVDKKTAKDMLYGERQDVPEDYSALDLSLKIGNPFGPEIVDKMEDIKPILFPEFHMKPIDHANSVEGLQYVIRRGIPIEVAKAADIWYSQIFRRVIFPIKMNGVYYGYQGRHIDDVPYEMRMRNNEGFRRDSLVMFADSLIGKKHAIIVEGPFNALKFGQIGGAVATMGKIVSSKQLDIIFSYGADKLYLGLDDDADGEMIDIASRSSITVYKLEVPQSCRLRCKELGKKPDFGECTFEEAAQAFKEAKLFHEII